MDDVSWATGRFGHIPLSSESAQASIYIEAPRGPNGVTFLYGYAAGVLGQRNSNTRSHDGAPDDQARRGPRVLDSSSRAQRAQNSSQAAVAKVSTVPTELSNSQPQDG